MSASTARRSTPAGAPEPSAGTRCATPSHSPHPTGTESELAPLFALQCPRSGLHSLFPLDSHPDRPWQFLRGPPDSGRAEELLNVSVRPAVRRARSSSWKLPPRGARSAGRPGGGVRAEPPPFPGEGSASPPFSRPRGGAGGGGEGAEAEVGGASRPTPPPEQRVPAAAPCRPPWLRRRRRGAPLPWEPDPARTL